MKPLPKKSAEESDFQSPGGDIPMAIIADLPEAIANAQEDPRGESPIHRERKKYRFANYRKMEVLDKPNHSYGKSRLHIKGISILSPVKVYIAALATLLSLTTSVLVLFIPLYAFAIRDIDWILITIPSVWIVSSCTYLALTFKCRCRVCRTPLFSLGKFLRSKKAHHLPLVGYTFSTALHVLLFLWFRCQACGTPHKLISDKE